MTGLSRGRRAHAIARPRLDPARVPFEQTGVYRRYGIQVDPDSLAAEQLYTKALIEEQGFDGLPHVVATGELDRYVRAGEPELFRGVSDARFADQLRSGPLFVGRGTFGGGIYAAGGADGRQHAAEYAQDPGSVIVRLAVKAGARIGDAGVVRRAMLTVRAQLVPPARPVAAAFAAYWAQTEELSIYAAYMGYDGLVDPSSGVWLILNRTALRIQREDIRP